MHIVHTGRASCTPSRSRLPFNVLKLPALPSGEGFGFGRILEHDARLAVYASDRSAPCKGNLTKVRRLMTHQVRYADL